MLVVFISPHSDPEASLGEPDSGGQCVYEYQLAKALSEMPETEVAIYCRQTFKRPDTSQVSKTFKIHRIHCGPDTFVPKEKIEEFLPEFAQKTQAQLTQNRDLVFHSHYWDGGKAGLLLQNLSETATPMVWTPHSLGSRKRQKFTGQEHEQYYNFIPRLCWENYTCFASQKIIVSTEEERKEVITDYGIEPTRITVIPPGIDLSQFKQLNQVAMRQKYGLPVKGTMLFTFGRLTKSKGYHHAIEALSALKKIYARPVFLVICGGSPQTQTPEEQEYVAELKQLAVKGGVEKKVLFRPAVPHDRINELYTTADVVLLFSEHEPFGLVMIEAMAMKRPVVAANAGGPSSVITHNQTGVLVNVKDPDRCAYYIRSMIKDKALVSKITAKAYELVIQTFDWGATAREFREQYELALQQKQNPIHDWYKEKYFLKINLDPTYAVLH